MWDDDQNSLTVFFNTGSIWLYENIHPAHYSALMSSGSLGYYFNKYIRNCYPSQKLDSFENAFSIKEVYFGLQKEEE
jgi:hypothetical protein